MLKQKCSNNSRQANYLVTQRCISCSSWPIPYMCTQYEQWWGLFSACLLVFICSVTNHSGSDTHYSTVMRVTSQGAFTHTHGMQQNKQMWATPRQRLNYHSFFALPLSYTQNLHSPSQNLYANTHNQTQITFLFLFSHNQCFQASLTDTQVFSHSHIDYIHSYECYRCGVSTNWAAY